MVESTNLSALNENVMIQLLIIDTIRVKDGTVYYHIRLQKNYDLTATKTIHKRFTEFENLNQELISIGLVDLPKFPHKSLFYSADIDKRRQQLEIYLKLLIGRKDIFNSLPLKLFLDLQNFSKELTYKTPHRLLTQTFQKQNFVTHCLYVDSLDVYLLANYNPKTKSSTLEIFAMNYKSKEALNRRLTSETPSEEIGLYQDEELSIQKLTSTQMPSKIKAIDIYKADNIVCVGLQDGQAVVFKIQTAPPSPVIDVKPKDNNITLKNSNHQNQVIHTCWYTQTVGEISFKQINDGVEASSVQTILQLQIMAHKMIKCHQKRLKSLVVMQTTGFMYTSDDVKRIINAYDLVNNMNKGFIQCSNLSPNRLIIDQESKLLMATTREGMLLFFDVNKVEPVVSYSMRIVKNLGSENHYVKQMQLDPQTHLLFLRFKNSDILVIQLIGGIAHKSTIIDRIKFKTTSELYDSLTSFSWLTHLNCYVEGTAKGLIKITKIENQGECQLILQSKSISQVQAIHYAPGKNFLFVANKDATFQIWKLPRKLRDDDVEQMEEKLKLVIKGQLRSMRASMV